MYGSLCPFGQQIYEWHIGSDWSEKESKAASFTEDNLDRAKFVSVL